MSRIVTKNVTCTQASIEFLVNPLLSEGWVIASHTVQDDYNRTDWLGATGLYSGTFHTFILTRNFSDEEYERYHRTEAAVAQLDAADKKLYDNLKAKIFWIATIVTWIVALCVTIVAYVTNPPDFPMIWVIIGAIIFGPIMAAAFIHALYRKDQWLYVMGFSEHMARDRLSKARANVLSNKPANMSEETEQLLGEVHSTLTPHMTPQALFDAMDSMSQEEVVRIHGRFTVEEKEEFSDIEAKALTQKISEMSDLERQIFLDLLKEGVPELEQKLRDSLE